MGYRRQPFSQSSLRNAPEQYVDYDSLRQLHNLNIRNKAAVVQHYGYGR